jgi:hypothetical protein
MAKTSADHSNDYARMGQVLLHQGDSWRGSVAYCTRQCLYGRFRGLSLKSARQNERRVGIASFWHVSVDIKADPAR